MSKKSVYQGASDYTHGKDKLGILLANLGTPEEPTAAGLRPFLRRFLNDQRVIENKTLWWKFLLNCIIIPTRSPKSAVAYRSIWKDGASPLNFYSFGLASKLQSKLTKEIDGNIVLELGMSYSKPSIAQALGQLQKHNITKLLVLPLYPQYSCSTVASVFDAVASQLTKWRLVPDLRIVSSYHDNPVYINALAKSIRKFRQQNNKSRPQLLMFSFHGMPLSSLLRGDPYHCQCYKTARLVAAKLGLKQSEYKVCFQSRFGRSKWLQPYTDITLAALPASGIKRVQTICPGFVADCVETLEEMDQENREIFLKAGGTQFDYIPCLNDSTEQLNLFKSLVLGSGADLITNLKRTNDDLQQRQKQAGKLSKSEYYVE